jgi:hypothetical protein
MNGLRGDPLQDFELQGVPIIEHVLKTKLTTCRVGGVGEIVEEHNASKDKQDILVYGRNGTYKMKHLESRCNNRNGFKPCRAGFFHNYYTVKGKTIYENETLKDDIIVVTSQTAFDTEFLVELVLCVQICNDNFEALSKKYSLLHNRRLPRDVQSKRLDATRKRIADAYFLYAYLELGQRYHIPNYQVIDTTIDNAILKNKDMFQAFFSKKWMVNHRCDRKGCRSCLVLDGGLKPHRMQCSAKLSGIRHFKTSGVKVVTGCTRHPKDDSKYCWEHDGEETPLICSDKVSARTRQALRGHRNHTAVSAEAGQDTMYVVESILDISEDQKKFKIKWVGFPEEFATWEDKDTVPKFILKYYLDNPLNLGKTLPNPTIKATKVIGDSEIYLLSWDGEESRQWLHEDFFKILDDFGDVMSAAVETSCKTRKSRDKRENGHTVGVLVGAMPCGTVVFIDELYGSESISQVYGILLDFYSKLSDNSELKILLYDDTCHLKRFSENPDIANRNQ